MKLGSLLDNAHIYVSSHFVVSQPCRTVQKKIFMKNDNFNIFFVFRKTSRLLYGVSFLKIPLVTEV